MTESKHFIRAKLDARTNADCSDVVAKNNRHHYFLKFEKSIGWDWLYGQFRKSQKELDTDIELWEIHPSGVDSFEVEIREARISMIISVADFE